MRFKIIDTAAAIVVLMAILLPPGKKEMESAYTKGFRGLVPKIADAQAEVLHDPQDGEAVYRLARVLTQAEQTDLAGQVAAVAANRTDAWEAHFALAVTHMERMDIQPAYTAAMEADRACKKAGPRCGKRDQAALEVYLTALKAGADSGADPKTQPTEFIQAIERATPVIRSGQRK